MTAGWPGGKLLGIACATASLVRGIDVFPEGNLLDAAKFDVALGFFMLTLAILAPGVPWTPQGQRRWTRVLSAFALTAYAIDTLQALRGLNPRFPRAGGNVDEAMGGVAFLVALSILGCFTVFAMKYFRAQTTAVVIAVRYGIVASAIAFAVGLWMTLAGKGLVPAPGNLLAAHALGFHGLQAIPMVAVLLVWGGTSPRVARSGVHVAGVVWVTACLAAAWQCGSGRSIAAASPATTAAAVCLLIYFATAVVAIWIWLKPTAANDARIY